MATKRVVQSDIDEAVKWLNANPRVLKRSINALKLADQCLCDAIALRPQTLLEVAVNTHKAAVAARAPKEVLLVLKIRRDMIKSGLARLPEFAYSWLSIFQVLHVESKTKARSLLTKAAIRSPDKKNRKALERLAEAVSGRQIGGGSAALPCLLCCALGCIECGPFCIGCCIIGCIICSLADASSNLITS